jgi:hypothetical protein
MAYQRFGVDPIRSRKTTIAEAVKKKSPIESELVAVADDILDRCQAIESVLFFSGIGEKNHVMLLDASVTECFRVLGVLKISDKKVSVSSASGYNPTVPEEDLVARMIAILEKWDYTTVNSFPLIAMSEMDEIIGKIEMVISTNQK